MKRNIKFFTIVISLLLLSSIILTGCMYAIAADNGEMKPYDLNGQKENSDNSGGNIVEDAPTAQDSLQAKFEAMYEISEDGKTITVISEEFLNNYWQSNYEKEVIKSLTTEEVYFIIQDSIRVYFNYDKVILPGFASLSSMIQVAERFPFVQEQEVGIPHTSHLDRERIETDIHTIIMYRLKALSSPKAFFTGADAIIFVGGDPTMYSGMYPESVFYIPGYSANTDRDYILSIMGGSTNFTNLERFTDLFTVSEFGGVGINFSSVASGSTTEVFPTEEMFYYAFGIPGDSTTNKDNATSNNTTNNGKEEVYLPFFKLNIANNTFMMTMSLELSSAISGTYIQEGDALILYPYDGKTPEGYVYVFYYNEGVGYEYAKGESNPIPGYEFESGQVFMLKDDILAPNND